MSNNNTDGFRERYESLVVKARVEGVLVVVASSNSINKVGTTIPPKQSSTPTSSLPCNASASFTVRAAVFEVADSGGCETVFAGPVTKSNPSNLSNRGGSTSPSYVISTEASDTLFGITARTEAPPPFLIEKIGCAMGLPKWAHQPNVNTQQHCAAAYGVGVCTLPSFVGWQGLSLVLDWVDTVGREVRGIASSDTSATATANVVLQLPVSAQSTTQNQQLPEMKDAVVKAASSSDDGSTLALSSLLAHAARVDIHVEFEPVSVMMSEAVSLRLPVVTLRTVRVSPVAAATDHNAKTPATDTLRQRYGAEMFSVRIEYEIIGLRLLHSRQLRVTKGTSLPPVAATNAAQTSWRDAGGDGVRPRGEESNQPYSQAILPDIGCTGSLVISQVLLPSQVGTSLNAASVPPWAVHGVEINNVTQLNPVAINISTQNVNALCDISSRRPQKKTTQRQREKPTPRCSPATTAALSLPDFVVMAITTKMM
jgi:hypothetical protein